MGLITWWWWPGGTSCPYDSYYGGRGDRNDGWGRGGRVLVESAALNDQQEQATVSNEEEGAKDE